jgi:predicted porin
MKKSLLALAALTAFAGVASAQSSVTLYGIVDAAARNVKNGSAGSLKTLSSGGQATSRLGFRGIEDLGGGLKAGFNLEGHVNTDAGTGDAVSAPNTPNGGFRFARRATVSLMGGFGELRLGRDFTAHYSNMAIADPFGQVGVATSANLRNGFIAQGSIATGTRTDNQIMYFLPAMGGLYGQINLGAGEGSGDKYTGGRLGYAAGPLNVGVGYGKSERGVGEIESMNVAATFNMGFATLMGFYENSEYNNGLAGAGNVSNDIDLFSVAMTVPMGNGMLKAQYTKADSSSANFDATSFGVGYVYNLSKRTSLYATYGKVNNDGNPAAGGAYMASGSGPGANSPAAGVSATNAALAAGFKRGESSTGYEFGITHSF